MKYVAATVSFVDCKTGEVMPGQHTIDLKDRELVWNKLPSTLEGWSPDTADCAFLFLSAKINTITEDALASGGGTDKWPRGAGVLTTVEDVRGLLLDLLEDPEIRERLPADKRRLLSKLFGEE